MTKDILQVAPEFRSSYVAMRREGVAALRQMFERYPDEIQADIRGLLS